MRRRRNPTMGFRRRNPTSRWGDAFKMMFLGEVIGAVAFGVNFGVEYIPLAPLYRTLIFGGLGSATALGLAKWGSPWAGASFAGGVGALLTGRIVTQVRMSQVAPGTSGSSAATESGALFQRMNPRRLGAGRRDAAAVFREGGAVYRESGAPTTMRTSPFGRTFKDTGASRYVPGPVRFYGPQSWAYDAGAVRVVSAHNLPK